MTNARNYLVSVYLDWMNNYLTLEVFAEHNGLTVSQATDLIDLARTVFKTPHPDA